MRWGEFQGPRLGNSSNRVKIVWTAQKLLFWFCVCKNPHIPRQSWPKYPLLALVLMQYIIVEIQQEPLPTRTRRDTEIVHVTFEYRTTAVCKLINFKNPVYSYRIRIQSQIWNRNIPSSLNYLELFRTKHELTDIYYVLNH